MGNAQITLSDYCDLTILKILGSAWITLLVYDNVHVLWLMLLFFPAEVWQLTELNASKKLMAHKLPTIKASLIKCCLNNFSCTLNIFSNTCIKIKCITDLKFITSNIVHLYPSLYNSLFL